MVRTSPDVDAAADSLLASVRVLRAGSSDDTLPFEAVSWLGEATFNAGWSSLPSRFASCSMGGSKTKKPLAFR